MRNQGYDLPDWVGQTLYKWNYMPDWDSYLLHRGWSIDSHMKFSQVPVSHDDFPHLLPSLSFSFSILPLPKNTKLSDRSPCHDQESSPSTAYTEYSLHQVQHTLSTAYTAYCIHRVLHHPKIDCLLRPASHSPDDVCTQLSTFTQLRVNQ